VKIALGADEDAHLVGEIVRFLEERGHVVERFGAARRVNEPWGRTALAVAESVARGDHEIGVVCCWTGTGVSIAANKVPGVRAALCGDAQTARGARRWNDANVLALSLRATSPEVAREIMEAWLGEPYGGTEAASLDAIRERERQSSVDPSRSSAR
jgi:ribose 5-phosphate isomerase B